VLLGLVTIPTNPLGWFLLVTGVVYSAGILIFIFIRRQRFWEAWVGGGGIHEERGDRSFWLVTLAMVAVFYLSPLEYIYFAAWMPRTVWMKSIGVGLVITGSALFVWARRSLGKGYSGHVSVEKEQELVQIGHTSLRRSSPYRLSGIPDQPVHLRAHWAERGGPHTRLRMPLR
jgi:hypothetical protein